MKFRYSNPQPVPVAGDGTAAVLLEPRGHVDLVCRKLTVSMVMPNGSDPPAQSTALVYVNGVQDQGSYSGNNDSSETYISLTPGEQIECRWSGGTPGALARFTIAGDQYPFGRSPARS